MPDKKLILKAKHAMDTLERMYPQAVCSLEYTHDYELLIATRLSAQSTDARVNIVTRELFSKYPSLDALNSAPLSDIERIVHPCGLFKTKARDVKLIAQSLIEDYGKKVPDSIEELTKLSGVGRKTANLIMGDIYKKDSVVCDTHCIRITNRMGLINTTDPYKAEMALREILDLSRSSDFCHRLVLFGREICSARNPKCSECPFDCKLT